MCDQQRLRPACAYSQSDHSLCYLLEYYMSVKLLTEHHLEFPRLKGGCTGSSESTLVKTPHCWKSHVTARIFRIQSIHLHHILWKERKWFFLLFLQVDPSPGSSRITEQNDLQIPKKFGDANYAI